MELAVGSCDDEEANKTNEDDLGVLGESSDSSTAVGSQDSSAEEHVCPRPRCRGFPQKPRRGPTVEPAMDPDTEEFVKDKSALCQATLYLAEGYQELLQLPTCRYMTELRQSVTQVMTNGGCEPLAADGQPLAADEEHDSGESTDAENCDEEAEEVEVGCSRSSTDAVPRKSWVISNPARPASFSLSPSTNIRICSDQDVSGRRRRGKSFCSM